MPKIKSNVTKRFEKMGVRELKKLDARIDRTTDRLHEECGRLERIASKIRDELTAREVGVKMGSIVEYKGQRYEVDRRSWWGVVLYRLDEHGHRDYHSRTIPAPNLKAYLKGKAPSPFAKRRRRGFVV